MGPNAGMDSFSKDGLQTEATEAQQPSQKYSPSVLLQACPDQGKSFATAFGSSLDALSLMCGFASLCTYIFACLLL